MIKEWFASAELAGLPGLPGTAQNVKTRAKKENWQSRPRQGRGGGLEYHISALPLETQRALLIEHSPIKIQEPNVGQPVLESQNTCREPVVTAGRDLQPYQPQTAAELTDWQRERLLARHRILRAVDRYAATLGREQAIRILCEQARIGQLPDGLNDVVPVANAKSRGGTGKQTLSRRTLYRWLDERAKGEVFLAPKTRRPEPLPVWVGALLQLYQRPQKPSLAWCIRQMEKAGIPPEHIPSPWQAQRLLRKMSKLEREAGRQGPRELKNIKPFVRRDTSELWPCDVYIADGHTFDAEIAHPIHGKPFRPEITSILDVSTRRLVGWSVDLAESGLAVLDALRLACCTGGIPAIFYTDNGSGYVNAMPFIPRPWRMCPKARRCGLSRAAIR